MGVRLILDAVLGARRAAQHSRFRRSERDDLPRRKRQQAERAEGVWELQPRTLVGVLRGKLRWKLSTYD